MPTDPLAWIGREAELGEWMNRKMDEARSEKMRLLYEHYGIDPAGDPEAGHKLALALACAHVPGFGFAPPGAGKPKRLKDFGGGRTLVARVRIAMEAHGIGPFVACRHLAAADPHYRGRSVDALYKAYGRHAGLPASLAWEEDRLARGVSAADYYRGPAAVPGPGGIKTAQLDASDPEVRSRLEDRLKLRRRADDADPLPPPAGPPAPERHGGLPARRR
jgi:hypothetical protein